MPVIPYKKTVDVDSYGFFAGAHQLGSVGGRELSTAQINALKPRLFRIYQMATQLFADIDNAKKTALVTWGTGELETALGQARMRFQNSLDDLRTAIESGRYEGFALRDVDVSKLIGNIVQSAKEYNELVKQWNAIFPSTKLAEILSKTGALYAEIIQSFQDLVSTGVKTVSWIPWVLGILFIGPPLLRIILAGRRGGVDSALEETRGTLERGRESVIEGGRQAAASARQASNAARETAALLLAPETGGASLALRGYSRKRRRSTRRR